MDNVNFSSLSWKDAKQIALQRTNILFSIPMLGSPSYRLWARNFQTVINAESALRKNRIFYGVMNDISNEIEFIVNFLQKEGMEPSKIVDIGCGHAFADLLLFRRFKSQIHLVDIETTDSTHHDYCNTGSGYASLNSAKRFLESNGVPNGKIEMTNPQSNNLYDKDCDLIISMISCGFHYPVQTYIPFVIDSLSDKGCFIFDMRKGTSQEKSLQKFSRIETVFDGLKYQRLAVFR